MLAILYAMIVLAQGNIQLNEPPGHAVVDRRTYNQGCKQEKAELTAYWKECPGCSGITASGKEYALNRIAASKHWKFGQKLLIKTGNTWKLYTVEDRGGSDLKKRNRFDIPVESKEAAIQHGRKHNVPFIRYECLGSVK